MTVHVQVKHVTASGRIDEGWEFVPSQHRIEARVRRGSNTLALTILVCSRENPRLGAHPLVRIDGETWRILPSRFVRAFPNRVETLTAISCPIGDALDAGEQLTLNAAPEAVSLALEAI